jgi:hypothetical protein
MNKLIIIGNGFDLAHGLPTSYKDFLLWLVNQAFKTNQKVSDTSLFQIDRKKKDTRYTQVEKYPIVFESISEFLEENRIGNFHISYKSNFFGKIIEKSSNNWVDIEREYFESLKTIFEQTQKSILSDISGTKEKLIDLNNSMSLIIESLALYLNSDQVKFPIQNPYSYYWFEELFKKEDNTVLTAKEGMFILNFNYTDTIRRVFPCNSMDKMYNTKLINIHGELENNKNPIIFGYGDETDEYYQKFEKMNDNEFLKHMKSFSYLKTSNYRRLFELLEKGDFEVHVMGHSLGISDRLLFNHIFEHDNFQKVQLYYYDKPNGTNDFYEKTQELSRHFKDDAKHKMRLKVVPFNESQPLPQLK